MKKYWDSEELIEFFTFTKKELEILKNKSDETKLGFAILFKFFQYNGRFPTHKKEISKDIIKFISKQLKIKAVTFNSYNWKSRTIKYHRAQIRKYFKFSEATLSKTEEMTNWLANIIISNDMNKEALKNIVYNKFKDMHIEPPTSDQINRIVKTARSVSEKKFFQKIFENLPKNSILLIDSLINDFILSEELESNRNSKFTFNELRSDPGRIGLESVLKEIEKLKIIQELELPENILNNIPNKILKKYRQRVISEDLWEIRRHPKTIRYTLLAIFFSTRQREIIDNLIELLIQIIHKIGVRAERKIEKEMINDFRRVNGKTNILYKMAEAALNNPDGLIKEILFPIVNETTLSALVKELKNTGYSYHKKVYTVMRSSYASHYRRMVPEILNILEFHSNNHVYQPIIEALGIIKKYYNINTHFFEDMEYIPISGVIKTAMKDIIIEKDELGIERINRINYEIVTLQALRDKLRCKEIWVMGADRYRNPDEDLPNDFEFNREENYKILNKPLNADIFIENLKDKMYKSLDRLNSNISKNSKVKILEKNNGWISVSPNDPQSEPTNIVKLKAEIIKIWPMTNLLDVLKETDLRLSFTNEFKTVATHERLNNEIIQKRLILSLFGLGTNTGLKRIASGNHGENYKNLLHIRQKFINKDNLYSAISKIVNGILNSRVQDIWGEATTSCASDSKKFGAWDQNLMTEWHIRYRGRGVMIYWHVEKKSACIYSQLKSCSSSEVSAMIDGLLRHSTDINLEKNFVDSHGQSEVAFAFCHLLGFNLMPRLKAIHTQKLYRPDNGINNNFSNLQPILTRTINWELIKQQYDQMIKYTTALRMGTAETESILKRFTRNNLIHPTYKALSELGKVIKTIFLCEYLNSEKLRVEINEGLNVVENWNSANSFIFYGKGGEISTNRLEDQEISVLSLHLLQNCLVYINTLMIQQILSQKKWNNVLTPEDYRALTPLIYAHINPYGWFNLNMSERINIES